MFTTAIIGRVNVGKTTLFNRLIGKHIAITHNMPGVTRDRKSGYMERSSMIIRLIDTAGLENNLAKKELEQKAFQQSLYAVEESDLCLLVIDGRTGITNEDRYFISTLRKTEKPVILAINKSENKKMLNIEDDIYKTNIQEIIYISAESGEGIPLLLRKMRKYYTDYKEQFAEDDIHIIKPIQTNEQDKAFNLAFVGRPNAGKSTIINKILGSNRLVTDSIAGTTRDSITIPLKHKEYTIHLVDTAGIRKKMNISHTVELVSVQESFRAIDFAHVVCLIIDATSPFNQQDQSIMDRVITEGRPVIIIINKIDLIAKEKRKEIVTQMRDSVINSNFQCFTQCFFTASATQDESLIQILDEAIDNYNKWRSKISTNKLNHWIKTLLETNSKTPSINRKPLKMKFISQKSSRPPTFNISSNFTEIPEDYIRFLKKNLAITFELGNIPIRIIFTKAINPFLKNSKVKTKRYKK